MKISSLKTLVFCFLLLPSANIHAQTVSGKWYGFGFPDVADATNTYMCEFIFTQKGTNVTGEFNYFFRNGYFSNKVKGTFDADTRLLSLNFFPIMYFRTENTLIGVDGTVKGEFILKVAQMETSLTGNLISDAEHKYTFAPIKIKLVKQPKNPPVPEPEAESTIPVVKETIALPLATPEQKIENEARRQMKMRVNRIIQILDVSDDSVRVDLYDNATFDYDTVSIFYNNNLTQYKQLLNTKTPISFYVPVDSIETNNDLVMFAENLGLIPPNAAIMVITDHKHRYEVSLESNYRANAAVRLRKLSPPVKRTPR